MKTLLIYYHPVIWDLAQTFVKLGHDVTVAVNTQIKDNYGTGADIIMNALRKGHEFNVISLKLSLVMIKNNVYDLVGCDGVFDGDEQVMALCRLKEVPFFNIQGYPNVADEPSDNILSFGWFLPIVQYSQKYPSEGHKKQVDWKNISENGRSDMKNICVFYPNFWELKKTDYIERYFTKKDIHIDKLVSGIQRFEECNKFCHETFKQIQERLYLEIRNIEGKPHEEFLNELENSFGLLHLKWADQPGIAVFESLLMARPVFTMSSFIHSSFNQEALIDGYNAVVADSVDELDERIREMGFGKPSTLWMEMCQNAYDHAAMLTDFDRQEHKLVRFLDRCIK